MPVFNEADGIQEFICEIDRAFSDVPRAICVIDDCSTDDTFFRLECLTEEIGNLLIQSNEKNLGHGPSTLRALRLGIESGADVIFSVDGDGQFIAEEMREFLKKFQSNRTNYAEGVRLSRTDPWFRKMISFVTRMLVLIKSHRYTKDANTPCRIYQVETLKTILERISVGALTPNLNTSIIVRKMSLDILFFPLTNIPRRGAVAVGSTWGKKSTILPSRRLITFCKNAILEMFIHPSK